MESAPLNYTANEGTTPTVSWTAPTNSIDNLTTYTVGVWLLNWQDGTSTALPTVSAGTNLSQQIPASEGLTNGASYFWAVYGCNDWTCGDWSASEWLFSTAPAPSAAVLTAPVDGATNTGTSVTLQWNASQQNNNPAPGQTHYYVDVYDQETGQFVQQNVSAGTATSETVSGLTIGDMYRWIVTACNGADTEQDCTNTLSQAGPTFTWAEFFPAPDPQAPWPGATISLYMSQNDTTKANDLGATVGSSHIPAGVIILNFGAQAYQAPYGAGTVLPPTSNLYVSLGGLSDLAMNFLQGYVRGGGTVPTTVAIGTNNYLRDDVSSHGYGQAGTDWANFVLSVEAAANNPSNGIAGDFIIIGANDMEPDWNYPSNTIAWLDDGRGNGYSSVSGAPRLINYGSCDGCDWDWAGQVGCTYQSGHYCSIANIRFHSRPLNQPGGYDWTVAQVYYISYGAPPVRTMPEIYGEVYAEEWQYIALYGSARDPAIYPDAGGFVFGGVLTQCMAADGPNNDQGYPASSGYAALWNQVNDPHWAGYTAQNPSFSSDIMWEDRFNYDSNHVLQLPLNFQGCVVQNHGYPYHP